MHRPPLPSEALGADYRFADRELSWARTADRVVLIGCPQLSGHWFFLRDPPTVADLSDWRLFAVDYLRWFEFAVVGGDFKLPLWSILPVLSDGAVAIDCRCKRCYSKFQLEDL